MGDIRLKPHSAHLDNQSLWRSSDCRSDGQQVMHTRNTYDVVVIGLGIMGAATLFHLARSGVKALGVEARGPLHSAGSSHGDSRVFRRAYFEGDHYAPMLNRSLAGWMELAATSSEPIALRTGGLFIGDQRSSLIQGSLGTAQRCGIAHEVLNGAQIARRFPAFKVSDTLQAVYEPDALMLFADNARLTYVSHAIAAGAAVSYGSEVKLLQQQSAAGVVIGGEGWQVSSAAAVLTVGSWISNFLGEEIGSLVTPMRIPVYRLDVDAAAEREHRVGRLPVFIIEDDHGNLMYGLPQWRDVKGGLKVGFHNRQLSATTPGAPRELPDESERLELWQAIKPLLPAVRSTGEALTCVYSMSRDGSFLIQRSRRMPAVVYASACSGHGFKFAPAIGEALAALSAGGQPVVDLTAFDPARFQPQS
jgi:sarcosine oxidase